MVGQFGRQDFMISRCGEQAGGQFVFVSRCSNVLSGIKFVWRLGVMVLMVKVIWFHCHDIQVHTLLQRLKVGAL